MDTEAVIESLAAKLAAADLDAAETDLLRTLIGESDEVEGYGELDWAREIRTAVKPVVIGDLTIPHPIDKTSPKLL